MVKYICSFVVLLLIFANIHAKASDFKSCYTVGVPEDIKAAYIYMKPIKMLYDEAGLCSEFSFHPYRRVMMMLINGQIDAVIGAPYHILSNTLEKSALPLPSPFLKLRMLLVLPNNVQDNSADLKIVYNQQLPWVSGFLPVGGSYVGVNTYQQVLNMFLSQKVDGFIADHQNYQIISNQIMHTSSLNTKTLGEIAMHHIVAIRHGDIVPLLENKIHKIDWENVFSNWLEGAGTP